MHGRIPGLMLASLLVLGPGRAAWSSDDGPASTRERQPRVAASSLVDLRPRPMDQIPPGTVIGNQPPKGWTNLIMQSRSRLAVGDVDSVPKFATQYTSIYLFTVLANVRQAASPGGSPSHYLEKVALGGAVDLDGKAVIATSSQTFGKDLGIIGRRVFQQSENAVATEIRQVARTRTMMVFDGKLTFLYHGKHSLMVLRHAIIVSPRDGKLTSFVWLLGSDGKGGYALAENTLQLLPPNLHEDRVLSVDADKFTLGIPSDDAFALVKVPQGTPVRFSPTLAALGALRVFTPEAVLRLEAELLTRYAPLADRHAPGRTARR